MFLVLKLSLFYQEDIILLHVCCVFFSHILFYFLFYHSINTRATKMFSRPHEACRA